MKILMLPRYSREGASSRYRMYNYVPHLESEGFTCESYEMLGNDYLRRRYAGRRRFVWYIASAYAHRLAKAIRAESYDLIWLEKEAFPYLPGWFESRLLRSSTPYVVDYDDADFHNYDQNPCWAVRKILGTKIDSIMHDAVLVVAGNPYIADRAYEAGSRRVELLPTVVDLARYPLVPPPEKDVLTIGWIGTPITSRFLQLLRPSLEKLSRGGRLRVLAIGAGNLELGEVPLEIRPWSEETEVADLQRIDVGIMPLTDSPSERGKCGLKLIQYMACGRPVVGSPVGVNRDLITDGVNGFKATTHQEWIDALMVLSRDRDTRIRMGGAGRNLVEKQYCLQVTVPRLAALLRSVTPVRE